MKNIFSIKPELTFQKNRYNLAGFYGQIEKYIFLL
ncbi:hypothetical protein LYNGBM3L_48200 [Moorena producens 3L]|uniref:Uncharacterized protein n=1 Tax=Moorena producens 3L TaxID=489825 RepID=F4XXL4_9CYAN|nr:hypothetical protein LYNGBM3L_48200 [Moorena producens 3L]